MTTTREISIVRGDVEHRAVGDGPGTLSWRAPIFGVLSEDFGGWRELVAPWSVTRTLGMGHQIAQYNHRSMIGSVRGGTLTVAADAAGVLCECALPDTTTGRDVAVLAERGDLTGASFTFMVRQPSYWTTLGALRAYGVVGQPLDAVLGDDDMTGEVDDACEIRVLMEIAMPESGPVDMPAYPQPVVTAKRSVAAAELAEQRGLNAVELRDAMAERRLAELLGDRPPSAREARGMSLDFARALIAPRRRSAA